jgi:hypothetical protein
MGAKKIFESKLFSPEFDLEYFLNCISDKMDDNLIEFLSNCKYLENVTCLNLKGAIQFSGKSFKTLY